MTAANEDPAFHLPKLRSSFGFENDTRFLNNGDDVPEFFDVKFCPYQPLDCDPVFAAVVVCKLSSDNGDSNPCSILSVIRDDDEDASGCCCTWTRDPTTGAPYICIGGGDAKVKIYDVRTCTLVNCFAGHGGDVNDLATSPIDSSVIASASNDTSIRIWSLEEKFKAQPCLCILAGEGHSWNLLSLAFHATGRYLVSGGHDQVINLWTMPDLPTEPVVTPLQVHYPHFSTSAVHSGIVDWLFVRRPATAAERCADGAGGSADELGRPVAAHAVLFCAGHDARVPVAIHAAARVSHAQLRTAVLYALRPAPRARPESRAGLLQCRW
ncbi:Polycomb protein esc [Beauveria bassiana D1-5]|uniref:Polycomb protein esc n=1 Tax=Beauveria bassiana D1-5 TaxID=1245745 RepID=A0A0A2VSL9_BEABA|nr:Polycomb protein esc [Beauveria bassiana D1-5]